MNFEEMAQNKDEYPGRESGRTDEYGNPICPTTRQQHQQHQQHSTTTRHGSTTGEAFPTHAVNVPGAAQIAHHRRSSSTSSSSEDDGIGGRRKKGAKEKIKEKLFSGGHKGEPTTHETSTNTEYGYSEGGAEKKGVMEKIKEKLPGHK